MDDLLQFLRARLDEDERTARAASDGPWRAAVRSGLDVVEGDGWSVCNGSDLDVAHIARHDPARVLAEVEAKREIVALHRQVQPKWCSVCDIPGDYEGRPYGCTTLRLLALPYADHPNHNEAWRP